MPVWTGSEGVVGYFRYLAEEERALFFRFLIALVPHSVSVPCLRDDGEPASPREELKRRGVPIRFAIEMLTVEPKSQLRLLMERQGLPIDDIIADLSKDLRSDTP